MKLKNHKKAFFFTKEIINLTKATSEEIEKKYLQSFLTNIITSSKHNININSKIFFSYFKDSNIYEIYFISNLRKNGYIFPFIFSKIHDKNKCELFISEKYFTLFSYGEFKLFKNFDSSTSIKDIEEFIKTRYKIVIDKVHSLGKEEINKLKESYLLDTKKISPTLIQIKNDKSSLYLSSFIIILFIGILLHYNFFYIKNKQPNKIDKKILLLEKRYNTLIEKKDIKKSSILLNIINQVKNFSLKLESFHLNKNKLYIFLYSTKKIDLLEFIDKYNGEVKINKLKFDQHQKRYNLEAMIVLK